MTYRIVTLGSRKFLAPRDDDNTTDTDYPRIRLDRIDGLNVEIEHHYRGRTGDRGIKLLAYSGGMPWLVDVTVVPQAQNPNPAIYEAWRVRDELAAELE